MFSNKNADEEDGDWLTFQGKVEEYRERIKVKYGREKAIFDKALGEVRKLCNDTEVFFKGIPTKIVKDEVQYQPRADNLAELADFKPKLDIAPEDAVVNTDILRVT